MLRNVIAVTLLLSLSAYGGEVFPSGRSDNMPVFPSSQLGQSSSQNIKFTLHGTCYAVNLRAHTHPLAADGCLNVRWGLSSYPNQLVDVLIPARYMDPIGAQLANPNCRVPQVKVYKNLPDPVDSKGPIVADELSGNGWTIAVRRDPPLGGGMIAEIQTPYPAPGGTIEADGSVNLDSLPKVKFIYMRQRGLLRGANGNYFGVNGALSVKIKAPQVADDGSAIDVNFDVPGAAYLNQTAGVKRGFCGSFYSPLMLFFNDERPRFSGVADFALLSGAGRFHWPEAGSSGYFLAMDRDKNGTIDSGDELFGADLSGRYPNGFEKLRELDTNHDNLVDARDEKFHDLVLWQDRNATGTTESGELIPISKKGVVSISLKYRADMIVPVSNSAQLRETAQFTFFDSKSGKQRHGEIVDVWLSPSSRVTDLISKIGK